MRRQALDLSWIVATAEDEFDHDALAREHPLVREPRRRNPV